ncbi:collagen alpha-1(XIV) chain-like [Pungitius pungitius]|uniref:collagen alpha-1(XIV) chain-like n=1 Tax=Pungitius pungitius TaxID=134920 RepID=UPI002E10EDBA
MLSARQITWSLWTPLVLLVLISHLAQGQVPPPRRLRFKVLSPTKLLISWKEPKGDFDSYLFLYNSTRGGQQREIIISKSDTKVLITDYSPLKDYTVSVLSVSGGEQSRPLQGRHRAEGGASNGEDKAQAERLTESAGPPEDDNEISGARTDAHKHCLQEKGAIYKSCPHISVYIKLTVLTRTLLQEPVAILIFNEGKNSQ